MAYCFWNKLGSLPALSPTEEDTEDRYMLVNHHVCLLFGRENWLPSSVCFAVYLCAQFLVSLTAFLFPEHKPQPRSEVGNESRQPVSPPEWRSAGRRCHRFLPGALFQTWFYCSFSLSVIFVLTILLVSNDFYCLGLLRLWGWRAAWYLNVEGPFCWQRHPSEREGDGQKQKNHFSIRRLDVKVFSDTEEQNQQVCVGGRREEALGYAGGLSQAVGFFQPRHRTRTSSHLCLVKCRRSERGAVFAGGAVFPSAWSWGATFKCRLPVWGQVCDPVCLRLFW